MFGVKQTEIQLLTLAHITIVVPSLMECFISEF